MGSFGYGQNILFFSFGFSKTKHLVPIMQRPIAYSPSNAQFCPIFDVGLSSRLNIIKLCSLLIVSAFYEANLLLFAISVSS